MENTSTSAATRTMTGEQLLADRILGRQLAPAAIEAELDRRALFGRGVAGVDILETIASRRSVRRDHRNGLGIAA